MRLGRFAIVGVLLLAACGSEEQVFVGPLEAKVVYGTDDRLEVYAHPDEALAQVARESVVALIPATRLSVGEGGFYEIIANDLETQRGVCPDASFANQPVAATCSGVLIADDLILTAGHCVGPTRPCDAFRYVFNYHLAAENTLAPIRESDVYSCSRIVLDLAPASTNDVTPDFAVIQLDRSVTADHVPASVRPATPLEVGDPISMIGSGSGLPAKIDSGAFVASAPGDHYVANLDAFEGHSGSASFDEDAQLAGILVSGRVPDYEPRPGQECLDVNVFDDSAAGEAVQRIAPVIDALCRAGEAGEELCGEKACDGEPCGAPPETPVTPPANGEDPPSVGGVVPSGSRGCSTAGGTGAPGVSFALLALSAFAIRLRRKAA